MVFIYTNENKLNAPYTKEHFTSKHFCNKKCFNEYNRGENVYNFKDIKETSDRKMWIKKNSSKWKNFRKNVLKRDEYKCKLCGSIEKLEIHHIIPYSQYPELIILQI